MDHLNPSGIHPGFDSYRNQGHVPTGQETVFNPPWNWCGEQAIGAPFDEFGLDDFVVTDLGLAQSDCCPTCGQKINK